MRALSPIGRIRAYAYGLVTTGTVLLFALLESGTEKFVSYHSRLAGTAIEVTIVLLATLAFRPIHRRVELLVEAAFTKRRREAREALFRLRSELTSYNDVHQVLRRVVEAVDHHMGTAGSAVYLRRGAYVAEASSFDIPAESVEPHDSLAIRLRSSAAPADARALKSTAAGDLAFPMMAGGQLIGFLTVTPHRIDYDADDRHALLTLAEAAGVALIGLDPRLRLQDQPQSNLPRMVTSFVGRESEIAEIAALLDKHDIVTLVGAGGVGKTRTALQVAAAVSDGFPDGVWFVELAPLTNGDHIPSTIAQALGITLASGTEPLQSLVNALKSKQTLLVLDNCEHVVDSARAVVDAVLKGCPQVKVLASSRQGLEIPGEQNYRLPPLESPTAIALFVERARAVDKQFSLSDRNSTEVADICARLDGIPLAIELAASKTSVLGLKQLSERLNERFKLLSQASGSRLPHQQTLRAMMDWSFDLLDDEERAVFRRLSVFAGGWTLPAAAAVCTDLIPDEWRVLELLSALVSKSLVVAEPSGDDRRYRMLNTIREYSREHLIAASEDAVASAKHARYYSDLVCSLAPLVDSLEDVRWQDELQPEIDNLRAAVGWTVFRGRDSAAGLSLLAQIEWPELLTTPREAIGWFDAAANIVGEAADETTKARILRHLVRLEWLVGRPIATREMTARNALATARAAGDSDEIARALANLAGCYRDAGRFGEAEQTYSDAYGMLGGKSFVALNHVLRNWAVSNLQSGDLDMARRRFTEVAQLERPGSEAHASALLNLGELEFAAGNVEAARAAARSARETYARLNAAPWGLVACNLGAYAMAVDDYEEARQFLGEALAIAKQSSTRWLVTALEHHAVLAGLLGDHERAATLVGFTQSRTGSDEPRQKTEQHGYDRLLHLLAQVYDPEGLAQRMSAGTRITEEQALEHAAAISQNL